MQKVFVTVSAILLHLAIGSIYAWSVLVDPIVELTGWSIMSMIIVFGVTVFCLGMTASLLGNKIKNIHPGKMCALVFVLYLSGMVLFSVAITERIFPLLLLSYGVLLGIGTGIGYLLPIPILMTWYTRFKGIASGMVITGFGLSSFIAAYGYHYCIISVGTDKAPLIIGSLLSLLIIPSIFFLRPNNIKEQEITEEQIDTVNDPFGNKNFRQLWILFFINISVGISVISCLAPMTRELFQLNGFEIAALVGAAGLVNGCARFIWSFISDFIGRPITVAILIVFELVSILSLTYFHEYSVYKFCILMIIACYGGMFALMPSYIADLFGTIKVKPVFGLILSAWGVAGLIAPATLRFLYERFGGYSDFFYGMLVLCCINFFVMIALTERNIKKI